MVVPQAQEVAVAVQLHSKKLLYLIIKTQIKIKK